MGQDPYITNPNYPADTNISLGVPLLHRAIAGSASLPLTYQWQRDGTNLPGATGSNLSIPIPTAADSGGYRCLITNALGGYTNTRTAILHVDPTFTKILTGAIVTDFEPSHAGSWADYNNDGFSDLYVANYLDSGTVRNTLYLNTGGTNFVRITASPLTTDFMRTLYAAWADYDNDGNVDLIAANVLGGTLAQRLYRNNGDGTFTAAVDSALRSDSTEAVSPWWLDYDNDGFLDLFMAKGISAPANNCLFRNMRDATFRKMTIAEVGELLNDWSLDESCFSVDFNNDGRQELTAVNWTYSGGVWYGDNHTWRPQADGQFSSCAVGLSRSGFYSWGDFDNDGLLDAFCNPDANPYLFHNLGGGAFADVTAALRMTTSVMSVIGTWGDFDNDGWLDLFTTGDGAGISALFRNNGDGSFSQILTGSPVHDRDRRRAPSWVDYDNDGFLDLFIAAGFGVTQKNLLYRNNGNANHWLKIKLDGRASNRSGIGAKVRVQATISGRTFWQVREISCGSAAGSQNGLLAHFGLGDAAIVTTLRIEWPSGIVQELPNVVADQFLTVVESQGYTNTAPQITGATQTTAGMQISFSEPAAGARYILEASTNLVSWTKLMARTSTGAAAAQFTDTRSTNYTKRFYRLHVP